MRRVLMMLGLAACSSTSNMGSGDPVKPDAAASVDAPTGGDLGVTCDGRTAQPLDATWTVMVGGVARKANVHVPASYDPMKRTPVVINLHGRTSNASQQALVSKSIAKSDSTGVIVVHPESSTSPTSWNSGDGCCDPAYSNNVDDVGFMRALIDQIESKLCIDPARVYMTGLSNGAYLAHRMACEMADRIAAIAPVAGVLQFQACHPTRAMPVFDVHGTADSLVSYSWVGPTIDYWVAHDHCTTTQTTYTNGEASCVTHGGCADGTEVVLCTIQNGGHQWPGGVEVPFLGHYSSDLNATDAMWSFFQAHPLPQ